MMNMGERLAVLKKNKNRVMLYIMDLVILLVFWGGMLRKSFNADTIYHMVVEDADVKSIARAGRYVTALGNFLLLKMGFRTTTNLSITMLLALIVFAAALYELQKLFEKWAPEDMAMRAGFYGGISLVFLNVLFAELLMFSEWSIYYALGYLAAIIGIRFYAGKKYLLMFLGLVIAVCTYQYTVIFAAVVLAFYIWMDQKEAPVWKIICREAAGVACCMGVGVLNLGSMYFLKAIGVFEWLDKRPGIGSLSEKVRDAWESLVGLNRNAAGIMPDIWLPLLFSLGVWGIIIYSCIKYRRAKELLLIAVVWFGSTGLLYVIPFADDELRFPPRMSFCFFLVQGLLAAAAYTISAMPARKLLAAGCLGYLLVQLLFVDFTVTNHFISNTLDKVYVNMVYQEIIKYEEESGIRVEKLAVGNDMYAPAFYDEVGYTSEQINERTVGQVTASLFWVVTGRYFEPAEIDDEIYERYFKEKDWNYFDISEQLIIDGDTAYWCVF